MADPRRLVDGHLDIACNVLRHGREDLSKPSAFYREREGRAAPGSAHQCTVTLPELRAAGMRFFFATLFENPGDHGFHDTTDLLEAWPAVAEERYRAQVEVYHRLCVVHDDLTLVRNRDELEFVLTSDDDVGFAILMEGADAIRSPEDVGLWWDRGVRIVGLHWNNPNRYGGSCRHPGPLTDAGRALLRELAEFGFLLDLSHASERTSLDCLEDYPCPVVITHSASAALVARADERLVSDTLYDGIVERDSVLGLALYDPFLKDGGGSTLDDVVRHIDHFAQRAGSARHLAIGSDLDGGFGAEAIPAEMDTIADLPKIADALARRGYPESDIDGIMGGNWLRVLRQAWR